MFAVQKLIRVAPRACRLVGQQKGFMSGPPRVRFSFNEKVAHGVAIALAIVATPVWVLSHIAEYRGPPEEDSE